MTAGLLHGQFLCHLIQRRMLPEVKGCPAEVVFEVAEGPSAGQRITGRVWHGAIIERAGGLSPHEMVIVYVAKGGRGSGGRYCKIIDFHPIREPTAALASLPAAEIRPRIATNKKPHGTGSVMTLYAAATLQSMRYGEPFLVDDGDWHCDYELFARVVEALCRAEVCSPDDSEGEEAFELDDYANAFCLQFAISGGKQGYRTAEAWKPLLTKYAQAIESCVLHEQAHISVYQYTRDAVSYQSSHGGSLSQYRGEVWGRWLTIDLDGDPGLEGVLETARIIVKALVCLGVPHESLLIFFSGKRGLHIQFPSTVAWASPQIGFEAVAGHFCQLIADLAVLAYEHAAGRTQEIEAGRAAFKPVALDWGMYQPNAMLRAPNTPHEKTGLFKIRLRVEELFGSDADEIPNRAMSPRPFEMPPWEHPVRSLLADCWAYAAKLEKARAKRLVNVPSGERHIFKDTLDFIHHGAPEKTRVKRLFRAAMNLLEFRCPAALLHALLGPPALMCGLSEEEISNNIEGARGYHERHVRPQLDDEEDDDDDLG